MIDYRQLVTLTATSTSMHKLGMVHGKMNFFDIDSAKLRLETWDLGRGAMMSCNPYVSCAIIVYII